MKIKCKICGTENIVTGDIKTANCATCLVPLSFTLEGNGAPVGPIGTGAQVIESIKAIGSCDFDDCWPTGEGSTKFYKDDYNIIYFHVDVENSSFKTYSKVNSGIRIYDSNENIMLEDAHDFDWKPNYDRIARSWIIKGTDGSEIKSGEYRAEFWVENSPVKIFYFTVTSRESEEIKNVDDIQQRMLNGVCIFCGGQFKKGLFGQKCSICGSKKNY